jgi:hypothetical protein
MKSRTVSLFVLGTLLVLLLAACSPASPASQPPEPEPAVQPQAGSHPPVILRVDNREEVIEGAEHDYADIYFTDPDGDAIAVTYRQVSTSLSYQLQLPDDPIKASIEAQKGEAVFTAGGRCPFRMELAFEIRIRDRAGNVSEPVTVPLYHCTTPPTVDAMSILTSGLGIAALIALFLALGFWLLFRKCPEESAPALRSTLLKFCLTLVVDFMGLILHEGGHALYVVLHGIPTMLYVHPFTFPGYARPFIDISIWFNILGSLTAFAFSLPVFLLFWKRRSTILLPLVMLVPAGALDVGFNCLVGGDFRNVIQYNGVSPVLIYILGMLFFVAGILLTFVLLPLFGLDPKDKKALFVLPAGTLLASVLSLPVACFLVPGSPIDLQYFLAQEIAPMARLLLLVQTITWFVFAVLYVTLYRRLYPKLPAWLRTETVTLAWKDLRLPALLAVISVVIGLIIIT